jgi:hypothetical protein
MSFSSSTSSSSSSSQLDQAAKALLDAQSLQGINYNKGLLDRILAQSDQRQSSLAQQFATARQSLTGLGDADRARINRDAQSRRGTVGAELAGTGLYNSTILSSLRQGVDRDRMEAIGDVDESVRKQTIDFDVNQINAIDRASGEHLGYMGNLGGSIGQMYAAMAGNAPMASSSTNTSNSSSFSSGGSSGGMASSTPRSLWNNFAIARTGPVGSGPSTPVGSLRSR